MKIFSTVLVALCNNVKIANLRLKKPMYQNAMASGMIRYHSACAVFGDTALLCDKIFSDTEDDCRVHNLTIQ